MNKCYTRKGLLRIDVEQGCFPPWGYGIAYWRYDQPLAVCYPLVINWIVYLLREVYFKIRNVPTGFESESYRTGFNEGLEAGKSIEKDAFNISISKIEREMKIDIWDKVTSKLYE